MVVYFCKKNG
uniref:Uncharacterized protein n=1 Tax=Anguilla anguilla TaxID=7936 RepID=A0A0E9XUD8_ANGAN